MKKKSKKDCKESNKFKTILYALKYLNWKGAYMLFPYMNEKGNYRKVKVKLVITDVA